MQKYFVKVVDNLEGYVLQNDTQLCNKGQSQVMYKLAYMQFLAARSRCTNLL